MRDLAYTATPRSAWEQGQPDDFCGLPDSRKAEVRFAVAHSLEEDALCGAFGLLLA